jgi:predicted nucleic-acid-binding protein
MIALDTNVVLRALIDDEDEEQTAMAAALVTRQRCFVPLTVVLEVEWILRGVMRLPRPVVAEGLSRLVSVENLMVEKVDAVEAALQWFLAGMDFPDALHVATAAHCERFATFDKDMIRQAGRIGLPLDVSAP